MLNDDTPILRKQHSVFKILKRFSDKTSFIRGIGKQDIKLFSSCSQFPNAFSELHCKRLRPLTKSEILNILPDCICKSYIFLNKNDSGSSPAEGFKSYVSAPRKHIEEHFSLNGVKDIEESFLSTIGGGSYVTASW